MTAAEGLKFPLIIRAYVAGASITEPLRVVTRGWTPAQVTSAKGRATVVDAVGGAVFESAEIAGDASDGKTAFVPLC